jgi:hypothetical protein
MSQTPRDYHLPPAPHFTAKRQPKPVDNEEDVFKQYAPEGRVTEPILATAARVAHRLIDRTTGKTYSAEQLAALATTESVLALLEGEDFLTSEDLVPGNTAPVNQKLSRQKIRVYFDFDLPASFYEGSFSLLRTGQPIHSLFEVEADDTVESIIEELVTAFNSPQIAGSYARMTDSSNISQTVVDIELLAAAANDPLLEFQVELGGQVFVLYQETLVAGSNVIRTPAPPYIRVANGKIYALDAGVWKSANLSNLT